MIWSKNRLFQQPVKDFLQRVPVNDDEIERFIMAGVFDHLEPKLPQSAMQYLYLYWKGLSKPAEFVEWYQGQWEQARQSCRAYTDAEKTRLELEAFGTLISKHPLERFKNAIAKIRRVLSTDLAKYVGKSVTLVGWPIASKEVTAKTGEPMEFWAFEDEVDVFHCVLFPKAYEKFCRVLVSAVPVVIAGIVQQEYGALTVNIGSVKTLLSEKGQ